MAVTHQLDEQAIFETARTATSREAREAYLRQIAADSTTMERRIRILLAAYDDSASFLETPAEGLSRFGDHCDPLETVGTVIGPYTLLKPLGEGGMGTVYLAEQSEPVQRQVALKVIKAGMDSRQVIARFDAERRALALMDHANIARVLDAGTTESGRLYFVMELVHGVPITQYCDEQQLPPQARLKLFIAVCHAIQHAHQKGVIHRDIKPSNVMVTLSDGQPVPKVIDFGIAKAIEQSETERALFTQSGTIVGTWEYMSPEQAEASPGGIDTRSDVYSLGVLLYELLTGTTPLTQQRFRGAAYSEMLRIIREEEPPKPSTRLSESGDARIVIAARRQMEPAKLTKLLRGELDWIAMKCLEKDRNRRYATVNGLSQDLQRHLSNEPVQACPPSARYRLRKFVRRNRVAVLAASVFVLLLAGGIVGTTWQAMRASDAERLARDNEQKAVAQKEKAESNLRLARSAVDKYLNAITDNPKLSEHDFFPLRKELLEAAVPFYRSLTEQDDGDPLFQEARAIAFSRLGSIRSMLGANEAAVEEYEAMRRIYAGLAAEHPAVPVFREQLASSYFNAALSLSILERHAKAEESYRAALAIRKQLADELPNEPQHCVSIANIHSSLGLMYSDLQRFEDAEAEYRIALKLEHELIAAFPADPAPRRSLIRTTNNLGMLLKAQKRYAEAETAYRECSQLLEELQAKFTLTPDSRKSLASNRNNLANVLTAQGKFTEAEETLKAALKLQEQLAAEFRSVPRYQNDLAMYHTNLGTLYFDLAQYEPCIAQFKSAIAIRESLVAAYPATLAYAIELSRNERELGFALKKHGNPEAALEWLTRSIDIDTSLLKRQPPPPQIRTRLRLTHRSRADALDTLRRHAEAVRDWERAIELDDGTNKARYEARKAESIRLSNP